MWLGSIKKLKCSCPVAYVEIHLSSRPLCWIKNHISGLVPHHHLLPHILCLCPYSPCLRASTTSHMHSLHVRSFATAAPSQGRRLPVASTAATSRSSTRTAAQYGTAGQVIWHLNQTSLERNDPRKQRVKDCIHQVRHSCKLLLTIQLTTCSPKNTVSLQGRTVARAQPAVCMRRPLSMTKSCR